jgi:hypothetical protein
MVSSMSKPEVRGRHGAEGKRKNIGGAKNRARK